MPDPIEIKGLEEINGKLVYFESTALPAEIRKATRAACNLVRDDYRAEMANYDDSGAMSGAAVVRAMKRSRVRIGHQVQINVKKLHELYEAYHGRLPNPRAGEDRPYFYPAIVELGNEQHEGRRPLRKSLYGNPTRIMAMFGNGLRQAIESTRVKEIKATWVATKIALSRKS